MKEQVSISFFHINQYLNALGDSAEQILSKDYKSIRAAQETLKELESIRNLFLAKASGGKTTSVSNEEMETVLLNLTLCRENITEAGEQELIDQLFNRFSRYRFIVQSLEKSKNIAWSNSSFSAFLIMMIWSRLTKAPWKKQSSKPAH